MPVEGGGAAVEIDEIAALRAQLAAEKNQVGVCGGGGLLAQGRALPFPTHRPVLLITSSVT
jgi:hypothetical protein